MQLLRPWMRVAALAGLVCGGWMGGAQGAEPANPLDLARQLNQAFIQIVDQVSASVVVIHVAHKPDFQPLGEESPFWEFLPREFRRQFEERFRPESRPRSGPPVFDGQGSGVVIRADGYILTNRHVVDGAEKIRVRFKDGSQYDAEVRGVDVQSDLAVLKIAAEGLKAARLADSDKVRVGEFAIAIGAPFELDYSVTFGHVSAKGRSNVIPSAAGGAAMDQDFIQTDASINPGNSGGPLVNLDGEVIGINTLIRGLRTGIGFAIPSSLAREVSEKLIADGKYTRAWLGIEIRSLKEDTEYRGLVQGIEDGVVVRGILKSGPAAKSDLQLGDVITHVDGQAVSTSQQLRAQVRAKPIDAPVTLGVFRKGKTLDVQVKPEPWPEEALAAMGERSPPASVETEDLGLTVRTLTRELAREAGVELTEGVLVTRVAPGGLAMRRGLQQGDVITEVNQTAVTTAQEFRTTVREGDLKRGLLIYVVRDGVSRLVVLKDSGD